MYEEQQAILSFKLYLENTRRRILNDNKSGLTDPAKLFEGLICSLYNIYYETDDFNAFQKPNQPTIDLISDNKKIAVSVKAREIAQSQTQIDSTVQSFRKHYPDLGKYTLVSQQFCDKPSKVISNQKIEIRYFGDLCNMFNGNVDHLKKLRKLITNLGMNAKTISYLDFIMDHFLVEACLYIHLMYGLGNYSPANILNITDLNFTLLKKHKSVFLPTLEELWNEIESKKYLSLDISVESIYLLDELWWIGKSMNRFHPTNSINLICQKINKEQWDRQKLDQKKHSAVNRLNIYFTQLCSVNEKMRKYLNIQNN